LKADLILAPKLGQASDHPGGPLAWSSAGVVLPLFPGHISLTVFAIAPVRMVLKVSTTG
jgi:hypothetical protein